MTLLVIGGIHSLMRQLEEYSSKWMNTHGEAIIIFLFSCTLTIQFILIILHLDCIVKITNKHAPMVLFIKTVSFNLNLQLTRKIEPEIKRQKLKLWFYLVEPEKSAYITLYNFTSQFILITLVLLYMVMCFILTS